jgi:alpha-glucosidase
MWMCRNKFFLRIRSKKRQASHSPHDRLIKLGAIVAACVAGLFLPAYAQPVGSITGTLVSTNYQGLKTSRTYQPFPGSPGATNPSPIQVVPIDDELRRSYHLDPFYKKTLTCVGVVIVGSDKVSDWAFLEAAYTLDHQLHGSPSWVRDALSTNKVRLAILAVVEYTMDLPENNRRTRTASEAAFQDRRSRGLGGMPNCSCAEENLLNLRGDPYGGNGAPDSGENITIHEFSHTVASAIGRAQGRNGDFWTKLRKAFADAKAPAGRLAVFNQGRQRPVYASTDEQEYWAEGAQAWFDHAVPNNSGGLKVRDDVKQKDPELAALLTEIYGDGPWRYHKTTAKNADGTPIRSKEELAHLDGLDAVRDQFPVFSVRNSPRVIALAQETAAQKTEPSGTNATSTQPVTNIQDSATPESKPSTHGI